MIRYTSNSIIKLYIITGLALLLLTMDMRSAEHSDNEFLPYIQTFNTMVRNDTEGIPVTFINIPQVYAGVCFRYVNGYAEIRVDRLTWSFLTEYQREQLVLHELGHCSSYLGHDSRKMVYQNETIPVSLMYPSVLPTRIYQKHRNYYINELIWKNRLQNH